MVSLKLAVASIFSRNEYSTPACFERLQAVAGDRDDGQDLGRGADAHKVAARKYAAAKRAMQKEERTMRAFCNILWGARLYSIYRSPNGSEWVLESVGSAQEREAVLIEVVSPERYVEIFGEDEVYDVKIYIHWHERRYMPVEIKSLDKEGLAEGLVASTERGAPFPVTRIFYGDWLQRC